MSPELNPATWGDQILDAAYVQLATIDDVDFQMEQVHQVVAIKTLTASRTITLPVPDARPRLFRINDDTGLMALFPVMVEPPVTDPVTTIDGKSSFEMTVNFGCLFIYTDGVNYFTTSSVNSSHAGQVKINDGNSVKPTIVVTAPTVGDVFPIEYDLPLGLSTYPTTKWPQNVNGPVDADVYDDTNESFLENILPGQVNDWRIIVNYSGKAGGTTVGTILRLENILSGFVLQQLIFVPNEGTSGTFAIIFTTIADGVSLPAPFGTGHGYNLSIAADDPITFTIDSVTRFSRKTD